MFSLEEVAPSCWVVYGLGGGERAGEDWYIGSQLPFELDGGQYLDGTVFSRAA
ncbi:hypothetical protein MD484_g3112, partial [Candolleomyces efflorescens]